MAESITQQFQERTEKYLRGSMDEKQSTEYWIELLQDGEKMSYFVMVGELRHLHNKGKEV